MHTSPKGLHLIEPFEGFRADQYRDSVGVPTIGFGTTAADVDPLPQHVTLAQAETFLKDHLARKYEPAVNSAYRGGNQNQFDALVSLAYNVGPGVVTDTATFSMARDLRAGNYSAASADFMHYVYAGGQRLQGLVNRRLAERALFDTPYVDPDPHHYLQFDSTVRDLGGGHRGSERDIVEEYDAKRKHPFVHRPRLATLRRDITVLQARLEGVMERDPKGNEANHRHWRHDQLKLRAGGKRVV